MPEVEPSPDPAESGSFLLDELHVDPATGEITGPGGREQVDPKVMAVLLMLARRPGELVSRTQLLEEIWPGGAIYDDTLTQTVYQLRQHLTSVGGGERFRKLVKTLPKRGYLLKAAIAPSQNGAGVDEGAAQRPLSAIASRLGDARRLMILLGLLLVLVIAWWMQYRTVAPDAVPETPVQVLRPDSVAVLPFINLSGNPDDSYLSAGIGDELRDRIGAAPGLRVVARRSSIQFSDSAEDAREIGRRLGVGRIIEGRFSRDQGRIFVAIELVDATSGFQMWSQSYDRSSQDLMTIQQALTGDVLAKLLPGFTTEPRAAPPSAQQLAAHDLILLARQYEQQLTDEQLVDEPLLAKVIGLYRQAIEIDPQSSEATARLGRMLLYQGRITEAEPYILKALELDPRRGETFTTLGLYYWAIREVGIGAAYRRAIELNPSDADALSYYAAWSWLQADHTEAVKYYRAALEIDPLNLVRYADLGYVLAFHQAHEEARLVLGRLLQLFPTAAGYLAAARISDAMGELDEAIAWALQARQQRPDDVDVNGQLAELFARLGDFGMAQQFEPKPGMGQLFWQRRYRELVDLGEELIIEDPNDIDLQFLLAFGHSALGQYKHAIAELEEVGLPETVMAESRRANETHAILNYVGALQADGREAEAHSLAEWNLDFNEQFARNGTGDGWVARVAKACSQVVLGDDESALELLGSLSELESIPWLPWLKDLACLESLENDARYLAVVAGVEKRIARVRSRLPDTLARHGVSLEGIHAARN